MQLGHAAATVRLIVERSAVEALHERDLRLGEQRTEQPGDEVRAEVADVGVEPAEDVARGRVERLPHRVALARARARSRAARPATATTRAPSHEATAAVESVEPSSSTTTSSTSATSSISVRRTVATMWPTVASSLRAGRHTDTVRPGQPWPSARSAGRKSSWRQGTGSSGTGPRLGGADRADRIDWLGAGAVRETLAATTRSSRAAEGRAL